MLQAEMSRKPFFRDLAKLEKDDIYFYLKPKNNKKKGGEKNKTKRRRLSLVARHTVSNSFAGLRPRRLTTIGMMIT